MDFTTPATRSGWLYFGAILGIFLPRDELAFTAFSLVSSKYQRYSPKINKIMIKDDIRKDLENNLGLLRLEILAVGYTKTTITALPGDLALKLLIIGKLKTWDVVYF